MLRSQGIPLSTTLVITIIIAASYLILYNLWHHFCKHERETNSGLCECRTALITSWWSNQLSSHSTILVSSGRCSSVSSVVIQTVDWTPKRKLYKTAPSAQTAKPDIFSTTVLSAVRKKQQKSEWNEAISLMTEGSSALWHRITGTFHISFSLSPQKSACMPSPPVFRVRSEAG